MTTGHEERGAGRCSNGRSSCETLLAEVDLLVPLAPDLGGCEHASGTAHVTVGGLTGTVSTTTADTWDTGDSATCSVSVSIYPTLCALLSCEATARCVPDAYVGATYQFPKTQHWSGDRPSRSQRMAAFCSWPYQCARSCCCISHVPSPSPLSGMYSY